jgi:hypothetical protein
VGVQPAGLAGGVVNRSQAKKLLGALAERYPDADFTVTPQDDGAQITMTGAGAPAWAGGGDVAAFSVGGDDGSPILRFLLGDFGRTT